jgi:glutaminyl-peptide cyclotransferase
MMISRFRAVALIALLIFTVGCQTGTNKQSPIFEPGIFDGDRAYQDVIDQVGFGPRYPGSPGHADLRAWLISSLEEAGWQPVILEAQYQGETIYNIQACSGGNVSSEKGYILLGAHYDTRRYADNDPDLSLRSEAVAGANDGASGVAVLLEIARVLPKDLEQNVCLVFFDAEDQGRIAGWEWVAGSRLYVEQLEVNPASVVIVDMIGDADQGLPVEQNSDPALVAEIWGLAAELGIETFLMEDGPHMLDDHTPFLQKEIPAVDIIDFSYPYWHTVEDTADKVSPQSLQNVGQVLLAWLMGD